MKKILIKSFCVFIVMTIALISSVFTASSHNIYSYDYYSNLNNVMMLQNEKQVFLIGTGHKTVSIDAVYPDSYNITLSLDNDVSYYNLCAQTLVMVCYSNNVRDVQIVLYNIETDTIRFFNVNSDIDFSNSHIIYANGYVYIAQKTGTIKQFSSKGKLHNEMNLGTSIYSLMTDYDENIYALTYSGMYSISNNSYTRISKTEFISQGRFIDKNIFVDHLGKFYKLESDKVSLIADHYCDSIHPSGGTYNDYFFSYEDNYIYAISKTDGNIKKNFRINADILQLYSVNDTILVLCTDSNIFKIYEINFSEFKNHKNNSSFENNKTDKNNNEPITSDKYNVDYKNMKITGISYSTTASQFKQDMNFSGYDICFYRYGKSTELKSGNVGTATIAKFYNDESTYEFELSVTGDITGEGNVNSRDEDLMFDYLLDSVTFNGVFNDSADIDNSGDIQLEDLVLLLRLINEQK